MKMKRMIVAMIAVMPITAGFAEDSKPFLLDTREVRGIESSIDLQWDASWIGGDSGATVVIEDNRTIVTNATGVGEFAHTLTGDGRHELTYTTYIDDVAQEEIYRAIVYKGKYMVHFESNGGEGAMDDCKFGIDMPSVLPPNTFTRVGYTFAGWTTVADGEVEYGDRALVTNLTETADATVNLYAVWSSNQYQITFDANGGEGGWSETMDYGTEIIAPTVSRAGHTFTGWLPAVATVVPASNVYYTAQWKINRHTITFDANGGTGGTSEQVDYGTVIVAPDVSRIGWTFKGWDKAIASTVPDEDVTYTAQWEINRYAVTFDANGGVGGLSAMQDYDSEIVPPAVSRAGCTFEGWLPSPDARVSAHDVEYVAQWKVWDVTVDSAASTVKDLYPDDYFRITNIVIGAEVECLPAGFFDGCDALESLTFLSPDTELGDNNLRTIGRLFANQPDGYWVVQGVLIGYKGDCPREIPGLDSVKRVFDCALEGCVDLEELNFTAESVLTTIGTNAFKHCTELQRMTLPPSLEEIGDEAFMGCSYLGNVIVPGSVKRVGDRAFKNCTGFTAAQIEYGVESLGEEAFFGDWRISEVDIPSTVTNIGVNAFGGDSSIIRIGLRGDVRKASEIFSNYGHIREATVKEGNGEIVDGLFGGFKSLMDVHFIGDCPALANEGRMLYKDTPAAATGNYYSDVTNALVTYVEADSTGWDGTPGSHSLPQAWPLVGSYRRSIAVWDSPTYLCRFDSNGGTLGVQDTYQYSEKPIMLPPEPVQTGYSFAGWWTQPVGGLSVTADTIFIEGVYTRLYAHWTKGHWVFLDPNGGTVVNDFVTYVEQSVYGVLPTPVRSGYAFGGWLYKGVRIEPETVINETADHTLVAQWTANLYSVRYDANGGDGDMEDQDFVYGTAQNLRKNLFTRPGYEFLGWATNEVDVVGLSESADGIVVYADCESVSNMTAVADDWIDLYAVWREPLVVAVPVVTPGNGAVFTEDSCTVTISCATQDATIYYSTKGGTPRLTETYRYKGPFEITDTTTIKAVAVVEGERSEYTTVTITKRTVTLADALGVGEDVTVTTGGNADWIPIIDDTASGGLSARSGEIGDGAETWLNVSVVGKGTLSFVCKVSCEHDEAGDFSWDRLNIFVDSVEREEWRIDGESSWLARRTVEFATDGDHNVKWIYRKDEEPGTAEGYDCAWVDGVIWTPKATVPSIEGDVGAEVTGDAENGFVIASSKTEGTVEVTIPDGVEPEKVTVAVSPTVETVRPNGANVKIVKGDNDITEFLDIPSAVEGVIDLTQATVKAEVVAEVLDAEKGAEVQLGGDEPTITTSETKPGLTYHFREGTSLEAMRADEAETKVGDGTQWTPPITVKGGDSGFYEIKVSK